MTGVIKFQFEFAHRSRGHEGKKCEQFQNAHVVTTESLVPQGESPCGERRSRVFDGVVRVLATHASSPSTERARVPCVGVRERGRAHRERRTPRRVSAMKIDARDRAASTRVRT
eukprot:1595263-Pleurochrysis_carterae.AAC.1